MIVLFEPGIDDHLGQKLSLIKYYKLVPQALTGDSGHVLARYPSTTKM